MCNTRRAAYRRITARSTESRSSPFRVFYLCASVLSVTKSPPERTAFIVAIRGFRQTYQAQPVPHYMALTRPCKFRIHLGCSQCRDRARRHRRICTGWCLTERAGVRSTTGPYLVESRLISFHVLCASVFRVTRKLHSSE